MNIVQKMQRDWNRRAGHDARYWIATEDYRSEQEFERSGEKTVRAIEAILGSDRGELATFRVLDIGCGIGRVLKPMAARVREIVGVDVSSEMVTQGAKRLEGISNATILTGSGVDLAGLEDGQFDLVYSYVAFQHMPREVFSAYLDEAHRVLGDGGWLVFQIYVGKREHPLLGDTLSLRVYEENDLATELRWSGFRIEQWQVEHKTEDGIESWLVLARRLDTSTPRRDDATWLGMDCGDTLSPLDHHLYVNLARNQVAEGHPDMAIETLNRGLEFEPGGLVISLELAGLLVDCGRVDDAIDVLEQAIDVHPDYSEGLFTIAQLHTLAGRSEDAVSTIDRAVQLFSDDPAIRTRAEGLRQRIRGTG